MSIINNLILNFNDGSTRGTTTIPTNSGGITECTNMSTGADARLITNTGGTVDISRLVSGGMTAGSIEGAGTYSLGSKELTVGLDGKRRPLFSTTEAEAKTAKITHSFF